MYGVLVVRSHGACLSSHSTEDNTILQVLMCYMSLCLDAAIFVV
jgi:hypothetical protein